MNKMYPIVSSIWILILVTTVAFTPKEDTPKSTKNKTKKQITTLFLCLSNMSSLILLPLGAVVCYSVYPLV